MKKMMLILSLLFLCTLQIYADDVYVFDEAAYGGPIGGFYSGSFGGPGGTTASYITGELDIAKLAGGKLLWVIPADSFTSSEMAAMSSFLNGGGRIGFLGEWYGFAGTRDDSINSAIAGLGGHISINTNYVDSGYPHSVSRSNNQILEDPLTQGVNTFVYGLFSPLSLSGSSKSLILGEDKSSILLAYENIGNGTIFVMGDQNPWDLDYYSAGSDNRALFTNLLNADTGGSSSVPIPAAIWLFGSGLLGLMGIRKKIKK